jgi:uncharacterized delta-60 repeat protein
MTTRTNQNWGSCFWNHSACFVGSRASGEGAGRIRLILAALAVLIVAVTAEAQPVITVQPLSRTTNAGTVATFTVTATGADPLRYQWFKETVRLADGGNISGSTNFTLTLSNLSIADSGGYAVEITDASGSVTSSVATLTVNFPLADTLNPAPNNTVTAFALQPDGKILVGGVFTTFGGESRSYLGRLNSDDTLDTTFNPGAGSNSVWLQSFVCQPDGKILVGGTFSSLCGQSRTGLGRLNADGTLDAAFDVGANSFIFPIALQPDGKILVGGGFTTLLGQTRHYIGRLNANGKLDTAFNPGAIGTPLSIVVQPDGKILVGGSIISLGGQNRSYIGRLNPNGTLDATFNPGASDLVRALALQPDGKILVGGSFTNLAGQSRNFLGRLNGDGTLDTTFNPGADSWVCSFALQADGKILVGGEFTTLGGQSRNHIGRLNADGTLDTTFDPGAGGGGVLSLALQPDGRILTGGTFFTLGGQSRRSIGRLNNTDSAIESFAFDGNSLTWLRSGTAPEISRAILEVWQGESWLAEGNLTRITGGWQITGLSLSTNSTVRVRGTILGGYGDSSSGIEEAFSGSLMITAQPTSRTNQEGAEVTFSVTTVGGSPMHYQWLKETTPLTDGVYITGSTNSTLTFSNVLAGDAGAYAVVISNAFGAVTSSVATLTVNSATDGFNPGAGGLVYSITAQSDGKLLVAGNFTTLGGQSRNYLGRLNADGTLDPTFNPGAYGGPVYAIALQADGKTLVGGDFSFLGGQARSRLGRLNADATLDSTFNPGSGSTVYSLDLQTDGKILVGGSFSNLGGQTRNYIGRLNANGTLDTTFNPSPSSTVYSLAVQADGKILVAGQFVNLAGQFRLGLGRLNSDGTLDASFNPAPNSTVNCIALQADGKILAGGFFTSLGGQSRSRIGRLNANGTVDTTFNPGASGQVYSLAVQADGKILVGGLFNTLGGRSRSGIGRLNADGTVDTSFNPRATGQVNALALQADGKILVGGSFSTLGGQNRLFIGRLNNTDSPIRSLAFYGDSLTWLRGGAAPELSRATLDTWQGGSWANLGILGRIPGGWQITGLSLSTQSAVRVRGYVPGGYYNGSSSIEETLSGGSLITMQPASRTNMAGTIAALSVTAISGTPMQYQWFKGAVPLTDGGNIVGSASANLVVSNVCGADAGWYSVVISNGFGRVISSVAELTVLLPPREFTGQATSAGMLIRFAGTPSYPYVLQSATNLVPPVDWRSVFTNAADADGHWSFAVTNIVDAPMRFYRAVMP